MIKLIFKMFRKRFVLLARTELTKASEGNERKELVYVDSTGFRYYRYLDDFDLPVNRIQQLEIRVKRMKMAMSVKEEKDLLKACKKAINGGNRPDISRVGFIIEELLLREDILCDPELYFEIAGVTLIREDEDPQDFNVTIHEQKIKQFKADCAGQEQSFFLTTKACMYIPYLTKSPEEWSEYYQEAVLQAKARRMMVESFLSESK